MRVRGWFVVIGRRRGSDVILFFFQYRLFRIWSGVRASEATLDYPCVDFGRELVYRGVMVAWLHTRDLGLG